jgi:hypothetical protein
LRGRNDGAGDGVTNVVEIERDEIRAEEADPDAVGFSFLIGMERGRKIDPGGGID